ncbi:TonB-dependent receptor [Nitrospirillum amazonense]|uniref:TonB-dependent receptor n=1 Tax=Nitrospirillum amazonense TaxID=28077 RepID=UPI002DD44666|nr:TonB-dependent receptor [Nitrospirillum amazonense]MEC4591927.1 TonB-dependent receptor [Nitrospirillum amazonense]
MRRGLKTARRTPQSAWILPLILAMGCGGGAWAQSAGSGAANASSATGDLEEIVVTGIRADLEKSLEVKRNASVVLDSINSTELGRFPDADVADSLAHLPGITISRTTGGEGQKVSVRGLGAQYNIVTWNNRVLATDDDGRDLAFDVLPSEVITAADVLKSPQASALEGSIGGTVNLRTASPFDNPGLHGGVHAEGDYNDMSTLHGQKYTAFLSDTDSTGTWGILIGAVHSDNNIRTDSLNAYQQNIYGPNTYPFDGSGNPHALAATPCCITFGSIYDEKKRDAVSGSIEWRPTDTLKIAVDGLWTRLQDPQVGYNESYYFPYGSDQNGNPTWNNATYQNGIISGVSVNDFQPEMVNNTVARKVDTSLVGINAKWQATSRLSLAVDAYRSAADRPEGGKDTFMTAGLVSATPYAEDILNMSDTVRGLPSLNVAIPPSQLGLGACPSGTASSTNAGYCSYTALMNSGFLNDNKYWSTHYVGLNGYTVKDQVRGINLDGSYDVNAFFIDRLTFGGGETRREKSRLDISNDWDNGSGQYGTLYNTAGCPIQCNPYSFASQGYDVVTMVSPPNFMQGAGGSFPTTLPRLNSAALLNFLRSLNGKPNPFYCQNYPTVCAAPYTPFDFSQTLPQENPYNSYSVKERTDSFYVEAEMSGTRWSGNIGVRVVRTETDASTAAAVPVSLWTPTDVGATQTWNVQYAAGQASTSHGSYIIPLPSANFAYWAMPEELQLRAAVAQTLSRPNLNQLAPTSSNNAINGEPQLFYGGTAGLRPIKAWQADLSAEWYYMPHAAFTVALFGKRIRDDIYEGVSTNVDLGTMQYVGGPPGTVPGTPFLWTVTAPSNGAKSTFAGIELTWQHMTDLGVGIHAQFTATSSQGYDQNGKSLGAIDPVPPITSSLSLIYDKDGLSGDITWDHASGYTYACSMCTEVPGWPAKADSFDWVTASVHYKFLHGFDVYVEAKNLTNSVARTYLNGNPLLPWAPGQSVGQSTSGVGAGYSAYGRTFVAGAAYQF